ncbi:UDP-Glc:alpha-D-GlcNAc-diphosphoundecaprenol beta-1,3-glucosyltransferase WfgD [Gimesia aquarii]|uniref:UDP-Glc:alpha-D-GlcNAc-diphosphoundecaprenol beta-1,3-glucosyltransferase WfgD n=2 Tax=Gimesia aquarii TaxID=2527964 RepID=A0A517VP18_9PLAN|nr:UDP-Glc:alpha-D-GlcNAc-diphosphoundecaprenol beta-1,3-glucosyltransferase WfgD [Gimesia aquarii]
MQKQKNDLSHCIKQFKKFDPSEVDLTQFQQRISICNSCQFRSNMHCRKHAGICANLAKKKDYWCEEWNETKPESFIEFPKPQHEKQPVAKSQQNRHPSTSARTVLRVAVVITSHNYGRFLGVCLESVLSQSHQASEIIVVDDSSTDNTKEVTEEFASKGVKYLRVENRSALFSRRDGYKQTESGVVLFVDADDILPSNYIELGMKEFTDQDIGVVYADHQHFGESTRSTNFPEYSQNRLFQGENFVSTCSFVRREALNLCDAWDRTFDESFMPEDYWMFQRISLDGWDFKKSKAVLNYRRHPTQMSQNRVPIDPKEVYYHSHGLEYQTVTLFIPLAGRVWAWERLKMFLDRQNWPHNQIKLILCDTSQDDRFSTMVKYWIGDCNYSDVRHFKLNVGLKGLAEKNRRDREVQLKVKQSICKIYNQLRLMLETPYCWILEDDVLPPDDVLERLMKHFNVDVGAVTAPYQSRFDGKPVVWLEEGIRNIKSIVKAVPPKLDEPQVTEMRGSGFGCLVARSEVIKQHVLALPKTEDDLDPYFFKSMGDQWRRLCDWSCRVAHWEEDQVFLIEESKHETVRSS